MRIQHNITAMNSYRNYSANTSAVAKSLEKLASGYRINRAGDDAAGLAISEKMRAQIAGLEQAQTNAKSGINLVQTAEGAMTEIHDMLNRMYTLAEQSANGTYDDDVDRVQLQKEVDSLKKEIDRIADSANYNGIKLLDGSLDGTSHVNGDTAKTLTGMALTYNSEYTDDEGTVNPPDSSGAILHKNAGVAAKTSFTVNLSGINLSLVDTDGDDANTLQFAMWQPNSDDTGLAGKHESDADGHGANLFDVLRQKGVEIADTSANASQIAEAIMKTEPFSTGKIELEFTSTVQNHTDPLKVEYEVKLGADGESLEFTMSDVGLKQATDFYKAIQDDKDLPATDKAKIADSLFRGNFNFGVYNEDGDTYTQQISSTTVVTPGTPDAGVQLAETKVQFTPEQIRDGAGVQIGDTYYVFAGSDKTYNTSYGDNVKIVDVRDLVDDTGKVIDNTAGDTYGKLTEALSRLSVAAKDNAMFHVEVHNDGNAIVFQEKATYSGDADLTTLKGMNAQLQTFTSIDTSKAVSGRALTLQIGDTADSYNQMKVNVEDMHCLAMGIGSIDISTQEGAAAAVGKIKNAVNYVSNTRGTMGALQNRLDHTINNLGVMQENIQDAESTIRDVDIAKEMMAYTKNNILVQSAQSMLAQANQLPQGVLQLLQ